MKTARIATTLILTIPLLAATAPQKDQAADALLGAALHLEEVAGDLEGAIAAYETILSGDSTSRAVAARALLRMGGCYETLGRPEARGAYERLLREYADQPEPRRMALERLEAMFASPDTFEILAEDPAFTLLQESFRSQDGVSLGCCARHFDFSPTGDRYVFRNPGSEQMPAGLYISDIGNTFTSALVTEDPGPEGFSNLGSPSWSPDGNLIAFSARDGGAGVEETRIFVVPAQGGSPRQIGDSLPLPYGLIWTPDSKGLTYLSRAQISSRDLDGRSVDIPHSGFGIAFPPLAIPGIPTGYSPDGKWLVTDKQVAPYTEGRDIWLMPAEGGPEFVRLTDSPGLDSLATWGRDGRTLYFISDRSGSANIWKLGIDPASGRPQGEPTQVTFYTDVNVHHPTVVTDEDGIAFVLTGGTSTISVADATRPESMRPLAVRGSEPTLSADGTLVFYRGEGPGQEDLFVAPTSGGTPRRLTGGNPRGLRSFYQFAPSPNGSSIAYVGEDADGAGLFIVPTAGGRVRRLVDIDDPWKTLEMWRGAGWDWYQPKWSPDGQSIAFHGEDADGEGIFVIRASGGNAVRVAVSDSLDRWLNRWMGLKAAQPDRWVRPWSYFLFNPQWSPDGSRLAYNDSDGRLHVVAADGDDRTTPARLEGLRRWSVRWSPDGRHLALRNNAGPGLSDAVFVVAASGGQLRRLSDASENVRGFDWHPDGTRLTYAVGAEGGANEIRTAYLDGRDSAVLVDDPRLQRYRGGAWDPSGRRFFFEGRPHDSSEWAVYYLDTTTGAVTLFSRAANWPGDWSWSGDGSTVAWASSVSFSQLWLMDQTR